MVGKHGTVLERLERHSIPEPNSGCWIWTGSLGKFGYGQIMMPGGKPRRAHKVSYEVHKGPVPQGLDVRHTCDMRCCINPDHLLVGTRKQNMQDAEYRGRVASGFKLPQTKLTRRQIEEIISDARLYKYISAEYDITASYVCVLKTYGGRKSGK